MTETQNKNPYPNVKVLSPDEDLYCVVKKVRIIYDVTDSEGNLATKNGVTQSPNSVIEAEEDSLMGLEENLSGIVAKLAGYAPKEE